MSEPLAKGSSPWTGALNLLTVMLVIALATGFGLVTDPPSPFTKKDIGRALQRVATSTPEPRRPARVVLGVNTNLDAVIRDGPSFLRRLIKLNAGPDEVVDEASTPPKDRAEIDSLAALLESFGHQFATASAGERFVSNATLWQQILSLVERDEAFERLALGGNAALMGEALAKEYAQDRLEVGVVGPSCGPRVAGRISSNVKLLNAPVPTSSFFGSSSIVDQAPDEIHLILEYSPQTTAWAGKRASRANRYILSADANNARLSGLEQLTQALVEQKSPADVLVIAGVHILDGLRPAELRADRLGALSAALEEWRARKYAARFHVELGSVGHADFSKQVTEALFLSKGGRVDSLGLNEQELVALLVDGLGAVVDAADRKAMAGQTPPVIKVAQGLQTLFDKSPKLSRVHFHSYSYHLIAQRGDAAAAWPEPRAAVAKGALVATTRACAKLLDELHGSELVLSVTSVKADTDEGDAKVMSLNQTDPVITWKKSGLEFHLAPVLACVQPRQTVGLGDFISASALGVQMVAAAA